jgi:hypothetical protein
MVDEFLPSLSCFPGENPSPLKLAITDFRPVDQVELFCCDQSLRNDHEIGYIYIYILVHFFTAKSQPFYHKQPAPVKVTFHKNSAIFGSLGLDMGLSPPNTLLSSHKLNFQFFILFFLLEFETPFLLGSHRIPWRPISARLRVGCSSFQIKYIESILWS